MGAETLKAPFPWFGGKSRVAPIVWERFGSVRNYVEPFFGSGAVLLGRPDWEPGMTETINDYDGFVSNFWRAVQADPEGVARWADWPVSECDLHARNFYLAKLREEFRERVEGDPGYFDTMIAGWWVWGLCSWIGTGFATHNGPWQSLEGRFLRVGGGVKRQLPHLGTRGRGVVRQLPHLGTRGQGVASWFTALSARLKGARICCGDWQRVLGRSPTTSLGETAVLLDPPYLKDGRRDTTYAHDQHVFPGVVQWCLDHGNEPLLRIALCGYEGPHGTALMGAGWEEVAWKAHGGYGNQSNGRGRSNAKRERIWFSPGCQEYNTGRQRGA